MPIFPLVCANVPQKFTGIIAPMCPVDSWLKGTPSMSTTNSVFNVSSSHGFVPFKTERINLAIIHNAVSPI